MFRRRSIIHMRQRGPCHCRTIVLQQNQGSWHPDCEPSTAECLRQIMVSHTSCYYRSRKKIGSRILAMHSWPRGLVVHAQGVVVPIRTGCVRIRDPKAITGLVHLPRATLQTICLYSENVGTAS